MGKFKDINSFFAADKNKVDDFVKAGDPEKKVKKEEKRIRFSIYIDEELDNQLQEYMKENLLTRQVAIRKLLSEGLRKKITEC